MHQVPRQLQDRRRQARPASARPGPLQRLPRRHDAGDLTLEAQARHRGRGGRSIDRRSNATTAAPGRRPRAAPSRLRDAGGATPSRVSRRFA
ncbi:MAG: hypothetical protein MZW92_18460 [Comamonadaceae bacterium]|nr:hypothetical protein [Comamonadaceae bacterium]